MRNRSVKLDPKERPIRFLMRQWDESAWILILVPIVLTLWVYFGKQASFESWFQGWSSYPGLDFYGALYEYGTAFVLMFLVPALFVFLVFRKSLSRFGLRAWDGRAALPVLLVGIPLMLASAAIGAGDPVMQSEYPIARSVIGDWRFIVLVEMAYIIFYLAWEFLFRGFMLFGLEERFGALAAILIQTIPSAIVHIGKPFSESFSAIFGGILFGYAAWRSRSIFVPMALHAVLGIGTDLMMILR